MRDERPPTSTNLMSDTDDTEVSFSDSNMDSPLPETTPEITPKKRKVPAADMLKTMHEQFMKIGDRLENKMNKTSMSADFFKHCQDLVDNSNMSRPQFIRLQKKILDNIYETVGDE